MEQQLGPQIAAIVTPLSFLQVISSVIVINSPGTVRQQQPVSLLYRTGIDVGLLVKLQI